MQKEFEAEFHWHRLQLLAIYPGQHRGGAVRREGRQFGQDHRPRSGQARRARGPGHARNGPGPRRRRPWHLSRARPAQPQHHSRSRQGGSLRAQHRRRQHRGPGGARRHSRDNTTRGRPSVQRDGAPRAGISRQHRGVGNVKVGYTTPTGTMPISLCPSWPTITLDTARPTSIHERNARFIPIKFSVRGRDLGGTVAEAQERIAKAVHAAQRIPHRVGRRVRGTAEGQERPGSDRAAQPRLDSGAALWPVQLAARQPARARRHSIRHRWRHVRALRHRARFQRLRRHRLHLAVRRIGDGRHSHHHLLQSRCGAAAWDRSMRCITPPSSGCARC